MTYNVGNDNVKISLDSEGGTFSLDMGGGKLTYMCTAVRLKDGRILKSTDLWRHEVSETEGMEKPGFCRKVVFTHTGEQDFSLIQEFCIYEDYLTASTAVRSSREVVTNYIAPFCPAEEGGGIELGEGKLRFLSAPFDNDKWAKFVDYPIAYSRMSYEFTVLHREESEAGLVLGSVDHDRWKTGFTAQTDKQGGKTGVCAICGTATEDTQGFKWNKTWISAWERDKKCTYLCRMVCFPARRPEGLWLMQCRNSACA